MFKKRCGFIVEEADVTTVLGVINAHTKFPTYSIGNCGWGGKQKSKWYIRFDVTDKQYREIIDELKIFGTLQIDQVMTMKNYCLVFERSLK